MQNLYTFLAQGFWHKNYHTKNHKTKNHNTKKVFIYTIFALLTSAMIAIIALRIDSIQSDIYSLLELDFSPTQKQALQKIQQNFAKDISFLSDDDTLLDEIFALAPPNLFSSVKLKFDDSNILDTLYPLRLALLRYETFSKIKNKAFFSQNAQELVHSFALRPLSPSQDFFNLLGHSSLLDNDKRLKLDIASARLYALDNITQKKYYFASARLAENINSQVLLDFILEARKMAEKSSAHLLIQGGAIFSAIGKQEGIKESIYMGGLSFILVGLLLFGAFGSVRIFWLALVIGFSFLCGLSGALLAFAHLHILSIVISTSLVGLIIDFAIHWLAKERYKVVSPSSIFSVRRIFLLGLFITTSGYGLFLLSPMPFLHQVAVISIFALVGAFFASFFLLPQILQGSVFVSKHAFRKPFLSLIKIAKPFFRKYIFWLAPFVVLFASVLLLHTDTQDDISKYSSLPKHSLQELQDFARISDTSTQKFILLESGDIALERRLMNDIKDFIDRYDGLSTLLLSPKEQQEIIDSFKQASKDKNILGLYENLGFEKSQILEAFEKVASLQPLSLEQILSTKLGSDFARFIISANPSLHPQSYISFPHFKPLNQTDELEAILAKYNASLIDFPKSINESFSAIKFNAIWLKIFGYILAFIALSVAFGLKKSAMMMSVVLLSTLASLGIVLAFGIGFNIFVAFGLIISSAVGIDYVLLAQNHSLSPKERVFGIALASLTSIISFCLLSLSHTQAVVAFGLSATLGMAFCALGAIALTLQIPKS